MKYDINLVRTRSLSEIREWIDDLTMYRHFISDDLELNSKISSPLRIDRHPSFAIYPVGMNKVLWKDFGNGDAGDIVKFVQLKYGINRKAALRKIWTEVVGDKPKPKKLPEIPKNKRRQIVIEKRRITKVDKEYWGQYDINEDNLHKYNIIPIKRFWYSIGKDQLMLSSIVHTKDSPLYAYKIYGSYKIYKPLSKNQSKKWRSNTNSYDIQGLEQLSDYGDLLIITKSLKDVMVLSKLGYNAVAPQSETSIIPQVVMQHLADRFDRIAVLYDNDIAGISNAVKLSLKYNLETITIPKNSDAKDISDYVVLHGYNAARKLLKTLLNTE